MSREEGDDEYQYDLNDDCSGETLYTVNPSVVGFLLVCGLSFVHLFAFRIMTGSTLEESVRRCSKLGWKWAVQG